ncbi:MAG: hypothetical protein MI741_21880, partial [Rhodospirillales bacterium]|nr:hypothetical protein [Rhodospirillales bacterium]
ENNDVKIYGNVFEDTGYFAVPSEANDSGGVIYGLSAGTGFSSETYNNTFVNLRYGCSIYGGGSFTTKIARNNIFYNSTVYASGANIGCTVGGTKSHNWYYGSGSQSEPNIQNGTGDPFVNLAGKDFRLSSPTNPGQTLSTPYNTDPLGTTRGSDGTWDRGAYEYTGGSPPPPTSTTFSPSDRVQVNTGDGSNLNVRDSANGTQIGQQPDQSIGTIVSGGTSAGGLFWWNVNFDSGTDGWVAEDYIQSYTPASTGNTYYISPNGSDSNDCRTQSTPCATLAHVDSLMAPGDTAYLMDGTFSNQQLCITTTGGSPSKRITWKALNDGKAVVDGQGNFGSVLDIGGNCSYAQAHYVTVEGIVFINGGLDLPNHSGTTCRTHRDYGIFRRISCYNADPDGNTHMMQLLGNDNLVEDSVF